MLDTLIERARAMATHDGVPVAAAHVHGAANQLQAELLRARDTLVGDLRRVFGPAPEPEPVPEPQPEPVPEPQPEPQPEPEPAPAPKPKVKSEPAPDPAPEPEA